MRSLVGQVALVTGAANGAGWQTAIVLADEGMKVCATARSRAMLERLHHEIVLRGGECFAAPETDGPWDTPDGVVSRCVRRFGRLDVLVEDIGSLRFTHAALPQLRTQGGGLVVVVVTPDLAAPARLDRRALRAWMRSLRTELAGTRIEVASVFVPRPRVRSAYALPVAGRAVARCLLGARGAAGWGES
jgi:NAD(P)-dependent dehydrogenase (short-subunit alcohol dehydrogenase family)